MPLSYTVTNNDNNKIQYCYSLGVWTCAKQKKKSKRKGMCNSIVGVAHLNWRSSYYFKFVTRNTIIVNVKKVMNALVTYLSHIFILFYFVADNNSRQLTRADNIIFIATNVLEQMCYLNLYPPTHHETFN